MPSKTAEIGIAHFRKSLRTCGLLICSLFASCSIASFQVGTASAASRHAAMAIDANSGEILYAESADELRHPASLTKMMTIYMVFEQLEAGRLMPWTKLKVSQEAASAAPTKLDLEPGEHIAVMDAVKALITKSANDMAIVLAEAIGGTEVKFAELMTQKARGLGMRNTTFRNASGLPDNAQVTTARDMLTLALRLQDDFPKLYPLFATRAFSYNGANHKNHNTLLGTFEGIDGIKTGYTRMSGFNIVTSMRRGEKHIVGAVFGGATAGTRNATMRLVLTRALLKASTKKTRKLAPVLIARPKLAKPQQVALASSAPMIATPRASAKTNQSAAAPVTKPPMPLPKAAALVLPTPPETVEDAANIALASADASTEPLNPATETLQSEPPTPIEIARVRPVMVALRPRQQAPVAITDATETATPAMSIAAAALADNTVDVPAAASRVASLEPQSFQPGVQQPQTIAFAQPGIAPTARAPIVPAAPTPQAAAALQRGAPPSTLQAQAQGLSRAVHSPQLTPAPTQLTYASLQPAPSRLRGPEVAPVTGASTGGFHIQIGAYASAAEAEKILKATQARSQALLKSASLVTSPVQKESRLLYRARFAGFDARSAADTCSQLRRAAIDCFVMKAD